MAVSSSRSWPTVGSMSSSLRVSALVAVLAAGCAAPRSAPDTPGASWQLVKGTATYLERMALPPGAVLEARVEDVSRAGAKAEVLGSTLVERPGNPPIA